MKTVFFVFSVVSLISACGAPHSQSNIAALPASDAGGEITVVESFESEPFNEGINPAARGFTVSVKFVAGGNYCLAFLTEHNLEQVHVGRDVHLVVRKGKLPPNRCPRNYAPSYKTLTARVLSSQNTKIFVDNVEKLGNDILVR